jgi:hypothetical protein
MLFRAALDAENPIINFNTHSLGAVPRCRVPVVVGETFCIGRNLRNTVNVDKFFFFVSNAHQVQPITWCFVVAGAHHISSTPCCPACRACIAGTLTPKRQEST